MTARLPRNTPDRIIDQIMIDLLKTEYGRGDLKKFPDLDLYELRSGDFRVVMSLGGNTFFIEGIVNRKNLDKLMSKV